MLVHTVFFWLKPDLTAEQHADFRRGVESLATIKATEKVFVGTPAAVPDRPVIDKSYSVGLTVLCKDIAAHNAYQVDPIHLAFIERCKPYWSRVQVYDCE
jgi:Stress responsive A/B Barrel Domain